jgi:hypothetical protein
LCVLGCVQDIIFNVCFVYTPTQITCSNETVILILEIYEMKWFKLGNFYIHSMIYKVPFNVFLPNSWYQRACLLMPLWLESVYTIPSVNWRGMRRGN